MINIQRYTQVGFCRRLEKSDNGELLYFINHKEIVNEKDEIIDELYKNNETLYGQWSQMSLENGKYLSKITSTKDNYDSLKILTKKYSIIAFASIVINILLIGYIGSHYL